MTIYLALGLVIILLRLLSLGLMGVPVTVALFAVVPVLYQLEWLANAIGTGSAKIGTRIPLLLLAITAIVAVGYLMKTSYHNEMIDFAGRSSIDQPVYDVLYLVLWILFGASVAGADLSIIKWRRITILWMMGALIIAVALLPRSGFLVDYNVFREADLSVSHLTYSDYVAIIGFFVLSIAMGAARWALFVAVLILLFLMQGRNTLLSFVIVVLGFEVVRHLRAWPLYIVAFVLAMLSLPLVMDLINDQKSSNEQMARMLSLSSADESISMRSEFFWGALTDLPAQAFVGDASLIIARNGNYGAYMHNVLSAWQMHGILMLLVIVVASLMAWTCMLRRFRQGPGPTDQFFGYILAYGMLGVLASKSYGFFPLWIGLGVWLSAPAVRRSLG